MSLSDTIIILLGALVLFGPKKLPELARQLGKIMGELRRASNEFRFQMEEELRQSEQTERARTPEVAPALPAATVTPPPTIPGPVIMPPETGEPEPNRISARALATPLAVSPEEKLEQEAVPRD